MEIKIAFTTKLFHGSYIYVEPNHQVIYIINNTSSTSKYLQTIYCSVACCFLSTFMGTIEKMRRVAIIMIMIIIIIIIKIIIIMR